MQIAFNIGSEDAPKVIDISQVTDVKPLSPEIVATKGLNTSKNWTAEIRCGNNGGGFVEDVSVKDIVAAFKAQGVELVHLAKTDEAVRKDWIVAVAPFIGREGRDQIFHSKVEFVNPGTRQKTEQWFRAEVADLPFGKAPGFARSKGMSGPANV